MESLVDEKVDVFWKGVDGGANKSGQIIVTFSEKKPKKTTWFQVYAGEVRAPSSLSVPQPRLLIVAFYRRRSRGNNGIVVASSSAHELKILYRIISAEIRQPKSDQGAQRMLQPVFKDVDRNGVPQIDRLQMRISRQHLQTRCGRC